MSRIRFVALALLAAATLAACSTPTAPVAPTDSNPSINFDTNPDSSAGRSGFQTGHG
jgi:hypothetical protein